MQRGCSQVVLGGDPLLRIGEVGRVLNVCVLFFMRGCEG